jgi:hypothetical protein
MSRPAHLSSSEVSLLRDKRVPEGLSVVQSAKMQVLERALLPEMFSFQDIFMHKSAVRVTSFHTFINLAAP